MAFNLSMTVLTFALFAVDKTLAVVGIPIRIPNIVLLFLFLLGVEAWIGCVAAMFLCRHKVRQKKFVGWGVASLFILLFGGLKALLV